MKKILIYSLLFALSFTSGAIATNSNEVIAKIANFNFKVNGETKKLQAQPIVVNGVSYIPVKSVAEMLGYSVDYDAASKTIELSNGHLKNEPENVNLTPVNSESNVKETTFNNLKAIEVNGAIYFRAIDYVRLIAPELNSSNGISFDDNTKVSTIKLNGKETKIPFTDENIQVYKGKSYYNVKFYQEP